VPGGGRPSPTGRAGGSLFNLLELLARRYALAAFEALWEAPASFRALASRLDAPEPQLSQRLRELREAGLVEVDEGGDYRLTSHGRRLQGVLEPVDVWAAQWAGLSERQRTPKGSASRARDEP
jgi:DNA-binding HxlR family transcriptional regulator